MNQDYSYSPSKQYSKKHYQGGSIFRKYVEGKALPNSPFKLIGQPCIIIDDQDSGFSLSPKTSSRGPYRKYTSQEKQEVVQCLENGWEVRDVSKKYGIPRRNLLRWKKYASGKKQNIKRSQTKLSSRSQKKEKWLTDQKQLYDQTQDFSRIDTFRTSLAQFNKLCQDQTIDLHKQVCKRLILADLDSTDAQLTQHI